jgi:hypothetical protein
LWNDFLPESLLQMSAVREDGIWNNLPTHMMKGSQFFFPSCLTILEHYLYLCNISLFSSCSCSSLSSS